MSKTLTAIYEGGVLRPLETLSLPEHHRVLVTIDELSSENGVLDEEYLEQLDATEIPEVSLAEVRSRLARITGSLTQDFSKEREERL